jgi:Leucine-rich repeat (LRR) protein
LSFATGDNNLSGSLPKELVAVDSLNRLDVSGNAIEGPLVELPPNLSYLDVEENSMSGSPFESVLGLSDLKQLRISSNSFTGTIPTDIGTLEELEELWIANNQFEGATIPSEIGNLQRLGTLVPSI